MSLTTDSNNKMLYLEKRSFTRTPVPNQKRFGTVRGFTLLELIIGFVIISAIVLAAGTLHLALQGHFEPASNEFNLQSQMKYVIEHITRNARNCQQILQATNNLVRLKTLDNEIISYRLEDNELIFTDKNGNQEKIAQNIKILNFDKEIDSQTGPQILKVTDLGLELNDKNVQIDSGIEVTLRNSVN